MTALARHIAAWTGGGILAAALLLFDLGTGSAAAPRWMAIYLGAIAILAGLAFVHRARFGWVDVAVGAVLGWAALSLLWSGDPRAGLLQWQNLACLTVVALFLRHSRLLDRVLLPVLAVALVAAVALGVVLPTIHGGFGNENFIAETLVIGLVMMVMLPGRASWLGWLGLAMIVAVLGYLFAWNGSHAQYAVLAAGAALGAAWLSWGNRMLAVALGTLAAIGVAFLALFTRALEPIAQSLVERAEIWLNTAVMIAERPLFGHGFGSYEYAYPRTAHLRWLDGTFLGSPTDIIGAAHNDYLQLIAELGLVGFALAGVLIWLVVRPRPRSPERKVCRPAIGSSKFTFEEARRAVGHDRTLRRAGLAALFVAGVLALFGFPFQTPMTAVLIAIAAGLAARTAPRPFSLRPMRVLSLTALPLAVSAALFYAGAMHVRDVHMFIKVAPPRALQANLTAYETYGLDPWVRLQTMLSLATVLRSHPPDKVVLEPAAADRIYEIARSAVPEHPGVLIARAEYLINSGRYAESDQIEEIFAALHIRAPLYPQAWAIEAIYAGMVADEARVQRSVETAFALPGGARTFRDMGLLITETEAKP